MKTILLPLRINHHFNYHMLQHLTWLLKWQPQTSISIFTYKTSYKKVYATFFTGKHKSYKMMVQKKRNLCGNIHRKKFSFKVIQSLYENNLFYFGLSEKMVRFVKYLPYKLRYPSLIPNTYIESWVGGKWL